MRTALLSLLLIVLFGGCAKDPDQDGTNIKTLPVLRTSSASAITNTTAASGGVISTDGNSSIVARGVCWSLGHNPSINGSHSFDGIGTGTFSSTAVNLSPQTTYYLRAYATNGVGTAYGNEISFTTGNGTTALPTLTTNTISNISATGASSGGNISSDGGALITARGICWATSSGPVVTGQHTSDGTGVGNFTSTLSGLVLGTTYYVRAYATNSVGTAYGNEVSFVTSNIPVQPTVTTTAVSGITSSSASSGGDVTSDGGATVTARGVCWGTGANPDISGNHSTNGTGTGVFTSLVSGLVNNTTYHIRAYATNSVGTSYGTDLTFTTNNTTILVAGYEYEPGNVRAKLWQNGTESYLAAGGVNSTANGVYATGADVYAVGSKGDLSSREAFLSKNGTYNTLPGIAGCGYDAWKVFASGPDVYVAGRVKHGCTPAHAVAAVWKNGVLTQLSDGTNDAEALSVFVSGSDVYVAGHEEEPNGAFEFAEIWKNGVATPLTGTSGFASANAIFVSGTDVFVAGTEQAANGNGVAKIWKNGVAVALTDGSHDAAANAVFVVGSDVYVVGSEANTSWMVAKIWKNGVATPLSNGTSDADAMAIFVSGTDVYVAGQEANGAGVKVAKIWKNGVATALSSGVNDAYGTSVFIK